MIERQNNEVPKDLKLAKDMAHKLAKALERPVSVDVDLGITIGNVTFGWEHVRDAATPQNLVDLVDYFEEIATEGEHFGIASRGSTDPGWEGWRDQSNGPIEKPKEFLATFEPPKTIRQIARKAFLGR